jgi:succinate dehydrogenase / fumarate reductase cytochrome b subunit
MPSRQHLLREGHPNRLGLKGWIAGGRWGPDRYLYVLHRLTGLALLLYFVAHIFVTSSRALGQGQWEVAMGAVSGPLFLFGEYLVFAAFVFHAINGLRLALAEVGIGTGPPIEPVYPYRTSLDSQRPWVVAGLLLIAAVLAIGTLDFFVWQ